MADPQAGDEASLTRAVKYVSRYPRLIIRYKWQDPVRELSVFTDSDWGGCVRSRRSISGGAMLNGNHLVQHWSRTQQLVALSSAEAELNAAVKAGQEAIGVGNLLVEMGQKRYIQMYGDSIANHGIITRQGTGKVKHLSVRQLWLQERTTTGDMSHKKVPRLYNWSDVLTHHFTKAEADHHFPNLGVSRAEFSPE